MTITKILLSSTLSAALAVAAGPALADEPRQAGLVNVEVSNIANDIARDLAIDVSQVPVTVQAPIGVAANVCGVAANVLARQDTEDASCTANQTSTALNQIVQRRVGDGDPIADIDDDLDDGMDPIADVDDDFDDGID
jgi:hypothetical protein